jgi:hypothetical protein
MASSNRRWLAVSLCAWVFVALMGCQKAPRDDISWAQRALERNPQLQVVAVDRSARAFTVRQKDTGELRMVQAEDVVGSLPSPLPEAATARTGPIVAGHAAATPQPPAADTAALASPEPAAAPSPPPEPAAAKNAGPGVIAAGPGYSISSARSDGAARARAFAPADSIASGLAVERRDEPIICQGARFLRIDSRNLEFQGDAISAEDGCEIHITNSRIAAKGVGISARAANVHIENSSIEGQSGSILASDGAQVYAEASKFRGVSRGLSTETLHDLGGNVWN